MGRDIWWDEAPERSRNFAEQIRISSDKIRGYAKMRAEPWFARGHGSARPQMAHDEKGVQPVPLLNRFGLSVA
jgi:hypothetical protein